jgi:hypothetical protein
MKGFNEFNFPRPANDSVEDRRILLIDVEILKKFKINVNQYVILDRLANPEYKNKFIVSQNGEQKDYEDLVERELIDRYGTIDEIAKRGILGSRASRFDELWKLWPEKVIGLGGYSWREVRQQKREAERIYNQITQDGLYHNLLYVYARDYVEGLKSQNKQCYMKTIHNFLKDTNLNELFDKEEQKRKEQNESEIKVL